ncbi:MAG: site-specific integrase [Nitrososphaerales archaeon]
MEDKFTRIERHLYKRQYRTESSNWSTLYYGIFVDWKGKRRKFPLGSDLKTAKGELKVLEARNIRREDFDKDKSSWQQGITFAEWGQLYFKEKVDPDKRSVERERRSFTKLKEFFGNLPLVEINRSKVMEYKARRSKEPIIRKGKPVEGSKIAFSTVNCELAFLRYLLNLAVDDEIIETVPRMKLQSEKSRKRHRIASDDEYRALLESMSRPAQRVLIGLYESAMRVNELLRLPWDMVDERAGMIRLLAEYVKEKAPRNVPITDGLQVVLDELKMEQKKIASISNRVFTRNGKPIKSIRTAFELALEKNGIQDLRFHDFRHTCITYWATMGIPREVVMAASGHSSIEMHDGYVNVKENHIRDAFKMYTRCSHEKPVDEEKAASY